MATSTVVSEVTVWVLTTTGVRREHWQSAGSATAAYVVTCAAMFGLHLVQPSPGLLTEQMVFLGASGLAGICRFVVLRSYVFATRRDAGTAPARARAKSAATVPVLAPA